MLLPQPLTTRNPLSVSVDRLVLHVSHQWNRTVWVLCLLLSLSIVFSGPVHVVASGWASPLLRAEGCPRCGGTSLCPSITCYGPLGCFPFGAVSIDVAVNTCAWVLCTCVLLLPGRCQRGMGVALLGQWLLLVHLRNCQPVFRDGGTNPLHLAWG